MFGATGEWKGVGQRCIGEQTANHIQCTGQHEGEGEKEQEREREGGEREQERERGGEREQERERERERGERSSSWLIIELVVWSEGVVWSGRSKGNEV